jgi:hypothetical protein
MTQKKCEHGRQHSRCEECGGIGICEHKRQKGFCKECGGSTFCEHGRIKYTCHECCGSQICEHSKRKSQCKECGNLSSSHFLKGSFTKKRRKAPAFRYGDISRALAVVLFLTVYCFIWYSSYMALTRRLGIHGVVKRLRTVCKSGEIQLSWLKQLRRSKER